MTGFKGLSNSDLVLDTKRCVKVETDATLAVLDRLREIHSRLLHLEMGYGSLHEFCVVELKYSDGAAFHRIHAMRLCDEIPKAKVAIAEGKLSLTTAASLQNYLEKEKASDLTPSAKEDLLKCVEGKSKRECENIFYPEKKGAAYHFIADDETAEDLKRLSELTAISSSDMAALIKKIARIARKAIDPELKKARKPKTAATAFPEKLISVESESFKRPYIAVSTKTALWVRDGSQCTYVDPVSKRRCSARFGLTIDHIIPVACGGGSELENLRLLCFAHNQLAAQHVFGKEKMDSYRKRPQT